MPISTKPSPERAIQANADQIVRLIKYTEEHTPPGIPILIKKESLQILLMHISDMQVQLSGISEQLTASQRRAQNARNELCLKCGKYREAHNGACDGCRWKE